MRHSQGPDRLTECGHLYACCVVCHGWHTAGLLLRAQFCSFPVEESGISSQFLCERLDRQYYVWLGLHQRGTVLAQVGTRGSRNLDSSYRQPWLYPNRHREFAWAAAKSRGLRCPQLANVTHCVVLLPLIYVLLFIVTSTCLFTISFLPIFTCV